MKKVELLEPVQKLITHDSSPKGVGTVSATLLCVIAELEKEIAVSRSFDQLTTSEIEALLETVLRRLGLLLTHIERTEVLAHLEREQRPFGILQELVDDPSVSDIIISDYSKISVQQGRKNFRTSLSFLSEDKYRVFVEKLLTKAGTTYSTKKPIADGMVGSFARVHAVHSSLCDTGPYVTIRLNRFSSVRLDNLVGTGLAPMELLAYFRSLVFTGHTLLIAGEVGTGKTTLARAIASTIPPDESIIVIEDTPEIRLDHPHVRYLTTREANTDGAGKVSSGECIRAGMRMAMNRIIFGEIRDAEAAESFIDVCASGHPGLSTIHAKSAFEAVVRLELFLGRAQKGVEKTVLSEQIATAVQTIAHLDICKVTGRRRVMEVKEIGPVSDGVLRQRDIFKYAIHQGAPVWKVCNKVSGYRSKLEDGALPFRLSDLPSNLELPINVLYKESSNFRE